MRTKREDVLELIKEYIACSKYMCNALKKSYDTQGETLLRARRMNNIPKEGILEKGFKFNFHGGGCYFEFDNGTIDIDFGPEDRCDGFDSFRLYDFLMTSKGNVYIHLTSEEIIKEEIVQLLREK